jgi:hypothetical protein
VLATTVTARLVTGRPVPRSASVDAHGLAMPRRHRLLDRLRQPIEVVGLLLAVQRSRGGR